LQLIQREARPGAVLRALCSLGRPEADVDSAGRILVPDYLKSFAGLKVKSVIAGVSDRVEVWEEDAWQNYTASIERDADLYAEKLAS
jgi:MraZ protein